MENVFIAHGKYEIKVGDLITFVESCNYKAPVLNGIVSYKPNFGFITMINGKQYNLTQLINITKKQDAPI